MTWNKNIMMMKKNCPEMWLYCCPDDERLARWRCVKCKWSGLYWNQVNDDGRHKVDFFSKSSENKQREGEKAICERGNVTCLRERSKLR